MTNSDYKGYRNTYYTIVLLLFDTIAYFVSYIFAFFSESLINNIIGNQFYLSNIFYELFYIILLYMIFIVFIASQGLYSSRRPFWKESRYIALSITLFLLFSATASFLDTSKEFSRVLLFMMWFYLLFFVIFFRYLIKEKILAKGFFKNNVIIIGNHIDAAKIARNFEKERPLGFNIVGIVTINKYDKVTYRKYKILGELNNIYDILEKNNINVGVFLPSAITYNEISGLIGKLQLLLSQIVIVPDYKGVPFSNAEINQTLSTELSYLQIKNNLKSFLNRFIKRSIDLLLSLLMLPLLLVFVLIISISIKLTSKGGIFYTQERVGRYGKIIKILKFRSMYIDADDRLKKILQDKDKLEEWQTTHKLKNDPRITFVGRFLRKTSLDELPQIFNVIIGDMSLIGPRPVVPYELERYYKDYSSYYLMVRPGITGLWQVSGRSNTSYEFRVSKDTWYVLNWSLWLDIVILLKTPIVVLKQDGAY